MLLQAILYYQSCQRYHKSATSSVAIMPGRSQGRLNDLRPGLGSYDTIKPAECRVSTADWLCVSYSLLDPGKESCQEPCGIV